VIRDPNLDRLTGIRRGAFTGAALCDDVGKKNQIGELCKKAGVQITRMM
jgi:hypothetical protein